MSTVARGPSSPYILSSALRTRDVRRTEERLRYTWLFQGVVISICSILSFKWGRKCGAAWKKMERQMTRGYDTRDASFHCVVPPIPMT